MRIYEADVSDAPAMSGVLEELIAAGRRSNRGGADFVCSHYLANSHRLHCFVAAEDGETLGFQSLKLAQDGNPYGTRGGWGIIGTHVRPSAARKGVGARLFAATLDGAREAKLPAIEAYIGQENAGALAYYEAMGFVTCRLADGAVCKAYHLPE